jgi:predicted outer membrane repeat protein
VLIMIGRCATALLLTAAGCIAQVSAATYVIQPDGGGDFPTIQAAIDASLPGDVIELVNGVFRGIGNRDLNYQGKAITIRSLSGNPASCILDCQGSYYQQHRAVWFRGGETAASVLDGVTIRNGFAGDGGAIELWSDTKPTIRGCVFEDNQAQYDGGAVYSSGAAPLFRECAFRRNHAEQLGGAVCAGFGIGPRFDSCEFVDNVGTCGVLWCEQGSASFVSCSFTDHTRNSTAVAWVVYSELTFAECRFERNSGQVVLGCGTSDTKLRMTHCTVRDNSVTDGWLIRGAYADSLIIEGCTITENDLSASDVISALGSGFVLTGTTIAHNTTGAEQAVLEFEDCPSAEVSNTIIAFHPGAAVSCIGSPPSFECVDIFGNSGGDWSGPIAPQYGTDGNISADPIFCQDGPGDYHIRDDSPCRPDADPECGLIGAWPVGCWASHVDGEELTSSGAELRSLPNPFAGGTRVILRLPGEATVSSGLLTVSDAAGRRVRTLRGGWHRQAPAGDLWWDGRDEAGRELPAGVYVLRLATEGDAVRRSIIKLR